MINPDRQKQRFDERLKRIEAGGANTMSQVYVGALDDASIKRGKSGQVKADRSGLRKIFTFPFEIIGAFSLGMFAVLLARFIRAALAEGALTGPDADVMMAVDGALGLAVGFALNIVFRMKGKVQETARTLGVVAMIALMHNFVHWAPGLFEKAFSPAWVADVISSTEPNSILFRGQSFAVGDMPAEPAPTPSFTGDMPQVIRLQ